MIDFFDVDYKENNNREEEPESPPLFDFKHSIDISDLNYQQKEAIKSISDWFKDENGTTIFGLAGYAGTGKTTIISHVIEDLQLQDKTWFVTFTGKASLNLNKKNIPAKTIHSLIYKNQEEYDIKKEKMIYKSFLKSPDMIRGSLIVIDEISMVSEKLLEDLLTFNIPILAIGDNGQLPPIGADNMILNKPDYQLTEIHRQAKDSPIISLATDIRNGKGLKIGTLGKNVMITKKISDEVYLRADQVLVGTHNIRKGINSLVRELKGYDSERVVVGDKIICRENNWGILLPNDRVPLINGTVGNIVDIVGESFEEFSTFKSKEKINIEVMNINFKPDFSDDIYQDLNICKSSLTTDDMQKEIHAIKKKMKDNLTYFLYGYAITVHSSQGSEWNKVLVKNDYMWSEKEFYNKWMYTAVTRAKESLIVKV